MELSGLNASKFWHELTKIAIPSMTDWVAPLLYYLAILRKAKQTVEVGYGGGYCSIALGLYARDFGARHTVIDCDQAVANLVVSANKQFDIDLDFICMDACRDRVTIPIDLLFVDVWIRDTSKFAALLGNFKTAIQPDGLIVIHDYYCLPAARLAVNAKLGNEFEILKLPFDGREPINPKVGMCGLAIARKL